MHHNNIIHHQIVQLLSNWHQCAGKINVTFIFTILASEAVVGLGWSGGGGSVDLECSGDTLDSRCGIF